MIDRIVLGYEREDPLIAVLGYVAYFSEREMRVAEISGDGKSDEEIAKELGINQQQVSDIKKRINKRAKEILKGQ